MEENTPKVNIEIQIMLQQKKVLVTGVFDILHQEHINFLRKAKKLGDILVVGIESDVRVKKMKGVGRPINSQITRKQNLEALNIAHEVFILPEHFSKPEDHSALVQKLKPDFLAVSSHTKHLEEKRKILKECGGEVVVVHEHNPKISTSLILQK